MTNELNRNFQIYQSDPAFATLSLDQWKTMCFEEFGFTESHSERIFHLFDYDGDDLIHLQDIAGGDIASDIFQIKNENNSGNNNNDNNQLTNEEWLRYCSLRDKILQKDEHLCELLDDIFRKYSIRLDQLEIEKKELQDICMKEKLLSQSQRDALAEEFERQLLQIQTTYEKKEYHTSLRQYEDKVKHYEDERESLQRRIETMQKTLEEIQQKNLSRAGPSTLLTRNTMQDLSTENQSLRRALKEAQSELALSRSRLASAKQNLRDTKKSIELERDEHEILLDEVEEKVQRLIEANRQLADHNDGLWFDLHANDELASTTRPQSARLHSFSPNFSRLSPTTSCDMVVTRRQIYRHHTTVSRHESIDNPIDVRGWLSSAAVETDLSGKLEEENETQLLDEFNSIENSSLIVDPDVLLTNHSHARHFRIILLGESGVGKTSFMFRLCKGYFPQTMNITLGMDFMRTVVFCGDTPTIVELWDTAGQERFRSISVSYLRKADGVIVMYDSSNEATLIKATDWISQVEEHQSLMTVLLLGNKSDLRDSLMTTSACDNLVTVDKAKGIAQQWGILWYETSSKDEKLSKQLHIGLAMLIEQLMKLPPTTFNKASRESLFIHKNGKKSKQQNCCFK